MTKLKLALIIALLGLAALAFIQVVMGDELDPPSIFAIQAAYKWRAYNFSWSAVPGAASYRLKRDDLFWYQTSTLGAGWYTKMMPGDTYKWSVVAVDPNGVESPSTDIWLTAPETSESPNLGSRTVNAGLFIFPDWTTQAFTAQWAQGILDDWVDKIGHESGGLMQISSTVEGWYMMPHPLSYYCTTQIVDPQNPNYLMWTGCDTIQMGDDATALMQNPSSPFNWFVFAGWAVSGSGRYIGVNSFLNDGVSTLTHEWGHNLGLNHAAPQNTTSQDGVDDPFSIASTGYTFYTSMGVGDGYSAMERYLVGWIPKAETARVTQTSTIWLNDSYTAGGYRLVYIPLGTTPPTGAWNYNFEYRQDLGRVVSWLKIGHNGIAWTEQVKLSGTTELSLGGYTFDNAPNGIFIEVVEDEGYRVKLAITIQGGGGNPPPPPIFQ